MDDQQRDAIEQMDDAQLRQFVELLSKGTIKRLGLLAVNALESDDIADLILAGRDELERIEELAAQQRERAFAKRPAKGKAKDKGSNGVQEAGA